jgi:multidrug efflux system outer membrane protein
MKNSINKNKIFKRIFFVMSISVITFYSCAPTQKGITQENKNVSVTFKNKSLDTLNTAKIKWKDFFSDENLISLIDTALTNNQELRIMLQQIEISKNEIKTRKGEYLPFVNYYAGADLEKVGKHTRNGSVEEQLTINGEHFPEPLANYSLGLSASWELDVWKKLRNGKKVAVLEYLSSIEGKNFMVTNLVSEIASSYYELMALDNQLNIINQNLEIQQNALKMMKLQKEAARVTELAVRRFDAEVYKNQSSQYEIQQKIVETENKLNFLIGRYPQNIKRNSDNFIEEKTAFIHTGIPSQLLENRPDIKRAEFELSAAKLNTKIAKANFYPFFEIKAGLGLQAFKPQFLTSTPESFMYSLMGDIVGPLINKNAIKAAYNNANSQQLQAIYEYEKTILNAFIEVENQLSNSSNLQKSYDLKQKQVQALKESIDLSILLFKSARAEYTEVLLIQREALDSKIEMVETKRDQFIANVAIYKSLGGGWK